MSYIEEDINEKALYVLKVNERGTYETDYVEIDKSLLSDVDIDQFYSLFNEQEDNISLNKVELFEDKKKKILDFYEQLYVNYPDVFGQRDYCNRDALRSANMNFVGIHHFSGIKLQVYPEWPMLGFFKPNGMLISAPYDYKELKHYTRQFFDAFFIEEAYKRCRKDSNIKIYSHRNVGWTTFDYKLNNILSVEISTNFAYGSSSYYFVTLKYDDIKIIPYSRLVIYYYARTIDLVRHTREYSVRDNSWKFALDFIKEASNDFLKNSSTSFITKYIINECELLIKFLPMYLETNLFNLSEHKDGNSFYEKEKFEIIKLDGFDLIQFRGEKVSGALNFIESLEKLDILIPTRKYIDCIDECCRKVEPQLNKSINDLSNILSDLEKEINIENERIALIKDKLSTLNPKVEEYEKEIDKLRQLIVDTNRNEGYSYNSSFVREMAIREITAKYPDYNKLMNDYKVTKEEFGDHTATLRKVHDINNKHSYYKQLITQYLETINEYLLR